MKASLIPTVGMLLALCSSAELLAGEDTCIEDGGTADCIGPEVGPFRYQVSDVTSVGQGETEAAAVSAFVSIVSTNACTFNLTNNLPPLQNPQIGHGAASNGNYSDALYYGIGQYWAISWTLSTETTQERIPLKYEGTRWNHTVPPCQAAFGPTGVYIWRGRDVSCPGTRTGFYRPNTSAPSIAYCYLAAGSRNPFKNHGPKQCENLANPVNAATGNKYQAETDYVGPGAMPLRLVRHYNSQLWGGMYAPSSSDQKYRSSVGPNWRTSFDALVRFSDSILFPTAYAYRPDGRTLFFKLRNGQFVGDADISDRLTRLTDGSGNPIGWKYTVAETEEVETYDGSGKLISIKNRAGFAHSLAYDGTGRLSTVTDAFGRQLTFGYDTSGRLANFTDPAGGSYQYSYSPAGNVSSVTYPDGRVRTYVYDETVNTSGAIFPFLLTGIVDENGSRFATYKYNTGERVISSEHAGGAQKHLFSYGANSTVVTDPLGTARTHAFTTLLSVARTTAISQPCASCGGSSAARTYDAAGNLASRTDFNGRITNYSYELSRNLETSRTEAYGTPRARTVATQWHSSYRVPTQIDELGKRTTFTHDANGNVLTKTERDTATSETRTWTYTYNSFGQVLTADGPRTDVSDVTTYAYYSCATGYQCGQVHTITNAAGHITTYNTYNAHGQPLTMTDPNGVVTTLTYDARQRLTSRTVGTEVTSFEYWPTGLLKKTTLPDASYLQYTYDAAHRLTDINNAEGNRVHYALDNMGNRTGEQTYDPSNALTRTRTRVFDTLNRLQKDIGAAGTANVTTTYGYDNNGNQTSIAAPLGRNTTQAYDELNRLSSVTDALNGGTQYGYNALDQLISVTDPRGLQTTYSYNALGDLTQQTSPDTGVTHNTYDSGGNLATSTDARSATTTYTYDPLNRVATTAFTIGTTTDQTLTYTYDAGTYGKGKLTGVADINHSLAWAYDDQGRVLTANQTVGPVSKTTSYAYANGLRQSMTTPSGQLITYAYTHGKVTGVSVNGTLVVSNILYDPFGPVRQWTWANGSLSVRTFDQDGKIAQIDSAGLKTYSYDDAFRITGITDTTNAALSWTYGYDDLDRLISGSKTGTTLGYTYDANGNRLAQTGSGASTFTIASNSNRLTSTSGALARTYGYDNAGNTTSYTGVSFTYNNRGRMKSSTRNGTTTNYIHNALGQLIKKGTSTLYYYDDAGHLLGTYNASGALTEEIVWLGDTPIASLRPKSGGGINIYNIHTDHLNTPRLITGSVNPGARWRWDGEPLGGGTVNNNPTGAGAFDFDLRFPGQMVMAEMGLYYNYFRDGYDPATGRYTQSDPIGLLGGLNTYGYAYQNPVSVIDPLGLDGWYCQRPLGKSPGTKGPPILNHQYLCVTRADGTIECGSQTTDGNGISGRGRPTRPDEDYYDEKSCRKVDDEKDRCYEQCVLYNFKKPRPRYGIGPQGTDCQEWSDTVNVGCKLVCGKNGKSREGFFSGVK